MKLPFVRHAGAYCAPSIVRVCGELMLLCKVSPRNAWIIMMRVIRAAGVVLWTVRFRRRFGVGHLYGLSDPSTADSS